MATVTLTFQVDAEAAKAYETASAEDQKKMQLLLSLRLQDLVRMADVPLRSAMDQLGSEAEARGLTQEILDSILHEDGDG